MSGLNVNIQNKCRSNKRCKCRGNKRHVSVKTGTVKGTNFGYSTHAIDPQHIRTTQISGVLWQNAELERIGFSNLFETAYSVTVFYNKIYDDDPYSINKPLLIRAKDDGQQIHWFENIGSHANKRWRRLRQDELKEFPDENNYSGKKEFETKLKALSCRLFVAHRIHIDFDQNKGYEIDCEICSEKLEIKVQQDSVKDSEGYKKYNYSGEFSENSILVYRRRQLTFQKRLRYKTGYYLPIPVDKDNFNIVSAYYWKEDDQKKNPLLIEFFSDNGYSYWIENISSPDKNGNYKHDKWRALPWTERIPDELKGRLDLLNCIYNKVVQIKIGSSGDCHPKRHILHRNRISYGYSEDYGTDPVLFSHKYWNSEGTRKSLNISEIYVGSDKQNFRSVGPPFRDVKMLIAYVSPCDKDKPFLMCLEYENKNYKWYQKKNKQGYWEEYEGFPDKRTPGDVKHQLGGILDKVRQGLGIGGCDQQTGAEGIQLDVNEVVPAGKSFHRYQYDSSSRKTPIFVTKAEKDPLLGFFKNTHKVYSKGGTFVLSKDLQNGGTIIAGSSGKISSVKEVEVYFWDANPKIPILLGITKKTQKEYTTYYGTLIQRWGPSQVSGMDKQQALDHQNCQKNNAIPIELTDPTDLERFKAKDNPSSCLKYKSVKSQKSLPSLPSEAVDYKVESYEILDVHKHTGTTRISRVTYNENPTNIVTTDAFVSQLRIYKWNNSLIPLLVEFKKSSGSEWHENLGDYPDYANWKKIHDDISKRFYDKSQDILTEMFADKLDEVNCIVNKVVQLDISQTTSKYCHGLYSGHDKRIQVTREKTPKYSGFIGYEHTPVKAQNLRISSIYNGKHRQKVHPKSLFPLENFNKVTVYFPICDGASPVAICSEDTGNVIWLKRTPEDNTWEDISPNFKSKGIQEIQNMLDSVRETINACNSKSPPPRFSIQQPYVSSQGSGSLVDEQKDNKKFDWKEILKEAEVMEEEEKLENDASIDTQEEYEDEEVIEAQNKVTFMTSHVTVDGRSVYINDTNPPLSTPTMSRSNSNFVKTSLSLIIDIERSITGKVSTNIYEVQPNGGEVKLEKNENPDYSGFYMFIHDSPDGRPFKVKEVKYRHEDIKESLGIDTNEEIIHLTVLISLP